jgi:predicted nucleic acid-binding Zn ribbon protein
MKPVIAPDEELNWICKDIAQRQRYRRAPQRMADVMSGLLIRRGYAQAKSAAECDAAWQQAAGPELGQHTRAGQIRRGVLEVLVRNSAVAQELTFRKKQLLKRLAELSPGRKIRDLRFWVGTIE